MPSTTRRCWATPAPTSIIDGRTARRRARPAWQPGDMQLPDGKTINLRTITNDAVTARAGDA